MNMERVTKEVVDKSLTSFVLRVHKYVEQFKSEGFLVQAGIAEFKGGVYRQVIVGEKFEKPFTRDIVDEHVVCKDVVLDVLKHYRAARDDDLLLILEVWRRQGVVVNPTRDELTVMFNPESITRGRRKIQNDEGLYLPTQKSVALKRRINEELLREYYGGKE
jgi:hypothetical protein